MEKLLCRAVENMVADAGGLFQSRRPIGADPYGVIVGGAGGNIGELDLMRQDFRRQLLGLLPGLRLARAL
jgi:hypothetical protein